MWRQRLKALWLQEGDQNTKFFHTKASQRRRKNRILKIQNAHRGWHEGESIDKIIMVYFQSLFTTSDKRGFMDFLEDLSGKVTSSMNDELSKAYTEEEVIMALKQMNHIKAPELDGMTPLFFQRF